MWLGKMIMMPFFHMDEIVKHVEIIKVSEKPTYDTSIERS